MQAFARNCKAKACVYASARGLLNVILFSVQVCCSESLKAPKHLSPESEEYSKPRRCHGLVHALHVLVDDKPGEQLLVARELPLVEGQLVEVFRRRRPRQLLVHLRAVEDAEERTAAKRTCAATEKCKGGQKSETMKSQEHDYDQSREPGPRSLQTFLALLVLTNLTKSASHCPPTRQLM